MPKGLADKPDMPEEAAYLWSLYVEVKTGCDSVGIVELDAYQRLSGVPLSPWESEVILQIENKRKAGQ